MTRPSDEPEPAESEPLDKTAPPMDEHQSEEIGPRKEGGDHG